MMNLPFTDPALQQQIEHLHAQLLASQTAHSTYAAEVIARDQALFASAQAAQTLAHFRPLPSSLKLPPLQQFAGDRTRGEDVEAWLFHASEFGLPV
jgi:hypothetical protein